jgi:hypothetical protein
MSMKTQGTSLFMFAPGATAVTKIGGITGFNPGGAPADQIDTTTLEDGDKTSTKGLRSPGQATGTVQADPRKAEHVQLYELSQDDSDDNCQFFIGWSDGAAEPTYDSTTQALTLPTTRTWFKFEGYVADFPMDFQGNTVVTTQLAIQRSGKGTWQPKAA